MTHTITKHLQVNATGINIATATCSCGATERGIEGYIRHWSMLHLQSLDDVAKGESQEHIGVQAIPSLTSTPRHGAVETSGTSQPLGAVAVALPSEVDDLLAACNFLALKRNDCANDTTVAGWAILNSAYLKLSKDLRQLLTGGAL